MKWRVGLGLGLGLIVWEVRVFGVLGFEANCWEDLMGVKEMEEGEVGLGFGRERWEREWEERGVERERSSIGERERERGG